MNNNNSGGQGYNHPLRGKIFKKKKKKPSTLLSHPTNFDLCIISVGFSPPELRGHRCREESLLPVGRPLRPEQPAGSPVQSHPVEEDGELPICLTLLSIKNSTNSTNSNNPVKLRDCLHL